MTRGSYEKDPSKSNWWSSGKKAWGSYDKNDDKMTGAYKDWVMSKDNYHWGKFVDDNKYVSEEWAKKQKGDENKPQDGYTDLDKWSFGKDYYGENAEKNNWRVGSNVINNAGGWSMRKVVNQHEQYAPTAGFSDDDIETTHFFRPGSRRSPTWNTLNVPEWRDKWASHYNSIHGTSDSVAERLAKFDHVNNPVDTANNQDAAQKFKDKKVEEVMHGGEGSSEPGPNPNQNTSQGSSNLGVPTAQTETDWNQYTMSQPDLMQDWHAQKDSMTAEEYGRDHYDKYGKAEGRPTDWTSDDEGADWEGYTKSYKDLNDHWQSLGGDQTAAEFGESHWYNHGKEEGRNLTQQQKAQEFKDKKVEEVKNNIDWDQYTTNQYDLRKAWESEGSGESASDWGKRHYNTSGKADGRQTDWTSDDEGADWEGYTKSNKDLNAYWQSLGGDQTAAEFGESHWYNHGKKEGRTLNQSLGSPNYKRGENPNTFANRGESVRDSERDAIRNRDGRISIDFPWQGPKWREGSGGNYEMPKQETSYKYQEYLNNFDPSPNSNKENTNSNNIHNKLKEMQSKMTEKYGFRRPDESTQDWSRYR